MTDVNSKEELLELAKQYPHAKAVELDTEKVRKYAYAIVETAPKDTIEAMHFLAALDIVSSTMKKAMGAKTASVPKKEKMT